MRNLAVGGILFALAFSCAPTLSQSIPARLSECETKGCGGDWRFSGRTGTAHWPNGVEAELSIERFDQDQVIIRRRDTSSSTLGVTAVYTGTIHGQRIEGDVTYSWPGHWATPVIVQWYATIEDSSEPAPATATEANALALRTTTPARGPLPNLNGIWRLKAAGQAPPFVFAIVQQGVDVTVVRVQPGEPLITYRGQFESSTMISGHSCAPASNPDNPNCLPEKAATTVTNPSHLKDSFGAELEKVAGPEDPRFPPALARAKSLNARPFLPEKPFDLAGIWQPQELQGPAGRINIEQKGGLVTMAYVYVNAGTIFTGRYEKNPIFEGTGKSRKSLAKDEPWSVFLDDPDHLRINVEGLSHQFFRITAPASHDLPCDEQNRYHVTAFHAWVRGQGAMADKDETAARCWLSISANEGYPQGQSLYAASLVRRTPPDYDLAFDMAVKSARQGDIGGELMLAQLFREGKGTAADPVKAGYWQEQAQRSQKIKIWQAANAKVFYGMSALDIAELSFEVTQYLVKDANEMATGGYHYNCMRVHTCGP